MFKKSWIVVAVSTLFMLNAGAVVAEKEEQKNGVVEMSTTESWMKPVEYSVKVNDVMGLEGAKKTDVVRETVIEHNGKTKVIKATRADLEDSEPYKVHMSFDIWDSTGKVVQNTINQDFLIMKNNSFSSSATSTRADKSYVIHDFDKGGKRKIAVDLIKTGHIINVVLEDSGKPNTVIAHIYFNIQNYGVSSNDPQKSTEMPVLNVFNNYTSLEIPLNKEVVVSDLKESFLFKMKVGQNT